MGVRLWSLWLCFVLYLSKTHFVIGDDDVDTDVVMDLDEEEPELPTEGQAAPSSSSSDEGENLVEVANYLEQLSDAELEKICADRGLMLKEDGKELTRQDYLEAAQQCISIEDDINALLNENPDLAAELDNEIERMKAHKERLEKERDEMLAEKALLEEQLREAGVQLDEFRQNTTSTSIRPTPESQTAMEVLKESFVLLYERVRQDVEFVAKILKPALEPVGEGLKLVWRYTKPTLESVFAKLTARAKDLKKVAEAKMEEAKQSKQAGTPAPAN